MVVQKRSGGPGGIYIRKSMIDGLVLCFGLYSRYANEIVGRIVKTVNCLLLLGLLASISAVSIGYLASISPTPLTGLQNTSTRVPSFMFHDAITIVGNADFATQGWPGDGTSQSPYIIEALEIVTENTCISITNTDVHFIIRNSTLSSPITGVGTGIYLSDVSNGTVENCTISSLDTGIRPTSTEDCFFWDNTLADCNNYGIYLDSGENCTVDNNRIIHCEGYGFFIYNLGLSTIEHNSVFSCEEMGMAIVFSRNVTVNSNVINDGGRFGLYITNTANCTFANNTLDNGGIGFGGDLQYWIHDFSGNTVNGKLFGHFFKTNDTAIDGSQFGQVFLIDCFNVSLSLGVFFNASVGVSLLSCTNCTISDAELSGNLYGINLLQSENTTLTDNTLIGCGVRFDGVDTRYWTIVEIGNTVNGKQFGYFLGQEDLVINGDDYGQLVLVDSDHLSIANGTFDSVTVGLVTYSCFNCSIRDASFVDNYRGGIRILDSPNSTLTNVTVEGNRESGLYISASSNTTVTKNKIHRNGNGIRIYSSDNFLFDSNQIYDNQGNSIYLSGTNYGTIKNNSIHDNGGSLRLYIVNWLEIINNSISESSTNGLFLDFTSGVEILSNRIYGNAGYGLNVGSHALYSEIYDNMIGFNGAGNAVDNGLLNEWDDGAGTGNVWSDYSGEGVYSISGFGVDNYPLGFVSRPADAQYVVGATVSAITWDVRLPNPDSYTILWDGVAIVQGSLNSSLDHLSKAIGGLAAETYNLTLVVNDESGYSVVDTVIITVIEEPVTTTTTTTTTTTPTGTTSTTTSTTLPPPPPTDIPMIFIITTVGAICAIVVLLFVVIRKK